MTHQLRIVAFTLLALLTSCASQRPAIRAARLPAPTAPSAATLRVGDLLFQDLDSGPLCDAIEAVTEGYARTRISHVAMILSITGQDPSVIEAGGSGVKITSLGKFLSRSHDSENRPKVIVGRLKPPYQPLIPQALSYAKAQIGKPYDRFFVLNEDAFYCSELLYFAFLRANAGQPLFHTAPMTFKDPKNHQFFPAWVEYFACLKRPIPESQPGLNPGGMSQEPCLEIIYAFGRPSTK